MSPTIVSSKCLNRVSRQPYKEGNKNRVQSSLRDEETGLRVWGGQETRNQKTEFQGTIQREPHTCRRVPSNLQLSIDQHKHVRKLPRPGKRPWEKRRWNNPQALCSTGKCFCLHSFTTRMRKPHNKFGIKLSLQTGIAWKVGPD